MEFQKLITNWIARSNYTRHGFSKVSEIDYTSLSSWLYGSRIPNAYQLIKLIDAIAKTTNLKRSYVQIRILAALRSDLKNKKTM
jgi:predicted transcriptional regulator